MRGDGIAKKRNDGQQPNLSALVFFENIPPFHTYVMHVLMRPSSLFLSRNTKYRREIKRKSRALRLSSSYVGTDYICNPVASNQSCRARSNVTSRASQKLATASRAVAEPDGAMQWGWGLLFAISLNAVLQSVLRSAHDQGAVSCTHIQLHKQF